MKLPNSSGMGVQSLGREDINAPNREWAAKANANRAMTGAIDGVTKLVGGIVAEQGKTKATLLLKRRLRDDAQIVTAAKDTLANTGVFNMNATGDVDPTKNVDEGVLAWWNTVKGDQQYNHLDPNAIRSQDISEGYTQHVAKTTDKDSMEVLGQTSYGRKLQADYVGGMTPLILNAAQTEATGRLSKVNEEIKAEHIILYQDTVQVGDEVGARDQVKTMVDTNVLSDLEGADLLIKLGGQIDMRESLERMNSDSPVELESLMTDLYDGTSRMSPDQISTVFAKAESKYNKIAAAQEAAREAAAEDRSSATRNDLSRLVYEGQNISYAAIDKSNMTDTDKLSVYALMNSMADKKGSVTPKSDPQAENDIALSLISLSNPSRAGVARSSTTIKSNLALLLAQKKITPDDFLKYYGKVDTMAKVSWNTPSYKSARDTIHKILVGGTEEQPFAMTSTSAANRIIAVKMTSALDDAYADGGPNFDNEGWVKDNIKNYATVGLTDALDTAQKRQFQLHAIKVDGVLDIQKTREALRAQYDNKAMPKEIYDALMDSVTANEQFQLLYGKQ